ncbi:MAG TPA: VOC family protein [Solirubrobacteraceae bacterium]|jgi:catechol 2,3-dioxygenase|nr:VOC family protein [Solirubrobacteraceae bacterium]
MSELKPPDIAHLGPAELFTPKPQESLEFFTEMMGMEVQHRAGQSVYLRGWDDYQIWSLKLTEAETSGLGYCGFRTWSPEALERRVALIEQTGLGKGWEDHGDFGVGRTYSFQDPDGHNFKIYNEVERYVKPADKVTDFKNVHGKQPNKAIAVKRLDHLNILAGDIRSQRDFCVDTLGYRLYERIQLDDGSEAGAWMSVSIAAHELIYTRDAYAAQGAHGRLHHVAFWVDTREECLRAADIWIENNVYIEFAPSKHNVAQGFFLYGYEPGGNRIEVTSGGRLVYSPDEPCVVWTEADRKKGQAWHNETVHTFHTYGTPPVEATEAVAH